MNRDKGYNQNEGGDSSRGYKHDKDVIESLKNKEVSEETRKRQSEAAKIRMKKYDYTAAHQKAVETTKARGSLKGSRNAMAKAVEQYDLDWNYIATIQNGTRPDAVFYGFHWKYK